MTNNTTVQTKKEFLEMLDRIIGDEEVILWTQNKRTVKLKKKLNEKRVTFGFSADAFDMADGVFDISNTPTFGVAICKRFMLSKEAKELVPLNKIKSFKDAHKSYTEALQDEIQNHTLAIEEYKEQLNKLK